MISHGDHENNYGGGDSEDPIYSRNSGFGNKVNSHSVTPVPVGYKIPSESIKSKNDDIYKTITPTINQVYKIPIDSQNTKSKEKGKSGKISSFN